MSLIDSIKNIFNPVPKNARIFEVNGMHCGHCESSVKNALLKIDGVSSVEASHKKSQVVVVADDKVTDEMIKNTIKETGFEVN